MPFRSEAQRRLMWLKHPSIAHRWAHEPDTEDEKKRDLPRHVPKEAELTLATWGAFRDELTKLAATRQVKELRKLYAAGDREGVRRLAERLYGSGVQKDSVGGVQATRRLEPLGRGQEGVAYPVFGPHGVEVRKQYDPGSRLWSPGLREDKVRLLEAAKGDPRVAQLYAAHEGPNNLAVHRMEHVPGWDANQLAEHIRNLPPSEERLRQTWWFDHSLRDIKQRLDEAAVKAGLPGHYDAVWENQHGNLVSNGGNIRFTPGSQFKVIDVMPKAEPPDLRRRVQLAPGHQRPFDFLDKYYPKGVPDAHVNTPDAELAAKLGPGSRQLPKPRAVGGSVLRSLVPGAVANEVAATSEHAAPGVLSRLRGMVAPALARGSSTLRSAGLTFI